MKFKEWLKINERATSPSPTQYRPSGNTGTLRGPAYTYGYTNTPGPFKQGFTAAATAQGQSTRSELEGRGLVIQGVGDIQSMPNLDEKRPGVKHYALPLQIPKLKHNSMVIDENRMKNVLEKDSYVTSPRVYREALAIERNKIRRLEGRTKDIEVEGKFLLLHSEQDADGKEQWNHSPNESKQFTRALIYNCIVDQMNNDPKERFKYDINSFEVVEEEEQDGVLQAWFAFNPKKGSQK
jgi:hypothetical protein